MRRSLGLIWLWESKQHMKEGFLGERQWKRLSRLSAQGWPWGRRNGLGLSWKRRAQQNAEEHVSGTSSWRSQPCDAEAEAKGGPRSLRRVQCQPIAGLVVSLSTSRPNRLVIWTGGEEEMQSTQRVTQNLGRDTLWATPCSTGSLTLSNCYWSSRDEWDKREPYTFV